jgi:hypothetical protein
LILLKECGIVILFKEIRKKVLKIIILVIKGKAAAIV